MCNVCDTVTQPVGGLSSASKDFTNLSGAKHTQQTAGPSSSFTTLCSDPAHTHAHTALKVKGKHKTFMQWIKATTGFCSI